LVSLPLGCPFLCWQLPDFLELQARLGSFRRRQPCPFSHPRLHTMAFIGWHGGKVARDLQPLLPAIGIQAGPIALQRGQRLLLLCCQGGPRYPFFSGSQRRLRDEQRSSEGNGRSERAHAHGRHGCGVERMNSAKPGSL
jgi:hypothetical protein